MSLKDNDPARPGADWATWAPMPPAEAKAAGLPLRDRDLARPETIRQAIDTLMSARMPSHRTLGGFNWTAHQWEAERDELFFKLQRALSISESLYYD
jgi:hypothetical protein